MCYCVICSYEVRCGDANCTNSICPDCEESAPKVVKKKGRQWKKEKRELERV